MRLAEQRRPRNILKQHLGTSLYQNAYYPMMGTGLTNILGFAFWVIATKFYSPEAVGLASGLLSSLGLLGILANLGLGIGLIRFLPAAGADARSLVNSCLALSGLASVAMGLVFLASINLWSPDLLPVREEPSLLTAFLIFGLVWSLNPLLDSVFLAKRATKFSFIKNALASVLKIGLVPLAGYFFRDAFGIFVAAGLATLAPVAIAIFWVLPRILPGYTAIPTVRRELISQMGGYVVGNYFARVLLEIPPMILPLLVIGVLGPEQNAYFYIAWSVTVVLIVIPSSIANSLLAEASNDESLLQTNFRKSLKLTWALLLPVVLLLLGVVDKLLLVFGQAYSENGALVAKVMALSVIPYGLNYLCITMCRITKDTKSTVLLSLSMAFLTIGFSLFLMRTMGVLGAGVGWLAGQSIVAMASAPRYLWKPRIKA